MCAVASIGLLAGCGAEPAKQAVPDGGETAAPARPAAISVTETGRTETMDVQKTRFGETPDGQQVDLYTLINANGAKVTIMNYGAGVVSIATAISRT